jgi:hypothetical protein
MPEPVYLKITLGALFVFLFSCLGIVVWLVCEFVSVGMQLLNI